MSHKGDTVFQFFPRPEARSMNWDDPDFLPPVRLAVRDLLLRIKGATEKAVSEDRGKKQDGVGGEVANCFLVYGDRGTGKTTVLLSAQDAVRPKTSLFTETSEGTVRRAKNTREFDALNDARTSAEDLRNQYIVWLDVLDVQPLPPGANLLTTLLTRVSNALDTEGSEQRFPETTSIFEEGAESARHKLGRLINDATLMWEDIHETDTRSRANRQVAAADIYAGFRKRFLDAMTTLSQELRRRSGSSDASHPIILPIDNIDRSTEHLHAIIKLAQMVSCPHLWLVMAGDREDIDTFLERAYWKELIRVGEGAGATGKTGLWGEDEALVMARRQAATASHKLLPPSHRIEVQLVDPKDTLEFCASAIGGSDGAHPGKEKISDFLKKIRIPMGKEGPEIGLDELFDAQDRVERTLLNASWSRQPTNYLTHAARRGLRLPARGVLDLWQVAQWVVNDKTSFPEEAEFKGAKIARTMLRNVIAESRMTSEMGRCLQDQVIRRSPTGGTVLDFTTPNPRLIVTPLTTSDFELRFDTRELRRKNRTSPRYAVRSALQVNSMVAILLSLGWEAYGSPRADGHRIGVEGEAIELPHLVAAWLSVLHDILVWAGRSWVVGLPKIKSAHFVDASHDVARIDEEHRVSKEAKDVPWVAPHWDTFLAYDVFAQRWENFQKSFTHGGLANSDCPAATLCQLLAAGWVACALETFWALGPENWEPVSHDRAGAMKNLKSADVEKYFSEVMKAAADVHLKIVENGRSPIRPDGHVPDGRVSFMREWLENKLPLLLSYLYLPVADEHGDMPPRAVKNFLNGDTGLAIYWKDNSAHILGDIERKLAELFADDEKPPANAAAPKPRTPQYVENLDSLGPFFALHRLWSDPVGAKG